MPSLGITGAGGLLGFHLRARVHALQKSTALVPIPTASLDDEAALAPLVSKCTTLVHLAYLITGKDEEILRRNREVAERLTAAVDKSKKPIHLVFASSTHIDRDTTYGASKRLCDAFFARWAEARGHAFTSLVLPHVFGESGKPNHNSVVSTFCHKLARAEEPEVTGDTPLELLHAQSAAEAILRAIEDRRSGQVRVPGSSMRVRELLSALQSIDRDYRSLLIPDLRDPLLRDLFNTYRSYLYPAHYPATLARREDARGTLFEAVKTRHGGQAFFSTTKPGITRGNHFHLRKLERFCVVRGSALIRIRKLFSGEILDFPVTGERPQVIDIPTLHTHMITNTGDGELMTLFWADEIFDPEAPDTFTEQVEEAR
jgi:UDP-2-acetamido-2,6-beta-L-arabino-hexul-4-ose reductase